jgi:hypothetical protein
VRNIGSEGTFWRDSRREWGLQRRLWWRIISCEGERFGKGKREVIWSGREERGVPRGRDKLSDVLSGAMGLSMIFTRLSIAVEIMDGVRKSQCQIFTGLGFQSDLKR